MAEAMEDDANLNTRCPCILMQGSIGSARAAASEAENGDVPAAFTLPHDRVRQAEAGLHKACLRENDRIGRDGHAHEQIDLIRPNARMGQRAPACVGREIRRALLRGDAPRRYARARDYPRVVGLDDRREIVVGHHAMREGLAAPDDPATQKTPRPVLPSPERCEGEFVNYFDSLIN